MQIGAADQYCVPYCYSAADCEENYGDPSACGYALAYGLSESVWMISDSLEAALFPDLTRLPDEEARRVAGEALRRYAIGGAAVLLLGLLAGEWILIRFFADRQPEAPRLFPLALAGAVAWGATRPAASFLYSRGRGSTRFCMPA